MSKQSGTSWWGFGVAALWTGFALFIVVMALITMRNDVQLVSPDYYARELAYQDRIDSQKRTRDLAEPPVIFHDRQAHQLMIRLPVDSTVGTPAGTVRFFRPADAALDFSVPLAVDSLGVQQVDLADLAKGLWKVYLEWSQGGEQYYQETILILD